MEHHIFFTILAITVILAFNFSTAVAMEEKSEFELAESGGVVSISNSDTLRTRGGLDPPAAAEKRRYDAAQTVDRFEMGESGIMIDFGSRTAYASVFGFFRSASAGRSALDRTAVSPPAFEAQELPESGRLIVFSRQVERRRVQALQMRMPDRAAPPED